MAAVANVSLVEEVVNGVLIPAHDLLDPGVLGRRVLRRPGKSGHLVDRESPCSSYSFLPLLFHFVKYFCSPVW